MRRLKFYIQSFLIDRRIWLGIFGVVLVAMMISYKDFYDLSYPGQKPAAASFFVGRARRFFFWSTLVRQTAWAPRRHCWQPTEYFTDF